MLLNEARYFKVESLIQELEHPILSPSSSTETFLSKDQVKDLTKLCGFSDRQRFKLLYRATIDGFSATKLDAKCDGQSTSANIFGEFTTKSWSQIGTWVNDSEAFIFSLINFNKSQMKFDCK